MATLYQSNTNDGDTGCYFTRSWVDSRKLATGDWGISSQTQRPNLTQRFSGRGAIVTSISRVFF